MFTGIILEIGRIESVTRRKNLILRIDSKIVAPKLKIGDSVAVNGACQTVVETTESGFGMEAIEETLSRTNLGMLKSGDPVNLEAPLSATDMFSGHFVQGHIDCVGTIISLTPGKGSDVFTIGYPDSYNKYVIEKGSICVDGISLTVIEARNGAFSAAMIPHTLENTVMRYRKQGDTVNLEFDMIAKYVERMMSKERSELTFNFLKEHGFSD